MASSVAAVVALAWVRLRRCGQSPVLDAQQPQQPQEMEWDNSTFNITINPLDRDVRLTQCISNCAIPHVRIVVRTYKTNLSFSKKFGNYNEHSIMCVVFVVFVALLIARLFFSFLTLYFLSLDE